MKKKELEGKFVLPGEKITEKSDFQADKGSFVSEGAIYAAVPGRIKIRGKKLEVRGLEEKGTLPPREGEFVIGRVYSVRRVHASMKLLYFFRDEKLFPLERRLSGSIYIGDVGPYVDEMTDAIRRGDIVLGKVTIARRSPLSISFGGRSELGCVAARCKECGYSLVKKGKKLYCTECEEYRKRKTSSLYDFETFNSLARFLEEEEG